MKLFLEALKLGVKVGFGIFVSLKELDKTNDYTKSLKAVLAFGKVIGKISRKVDTIILGIRFPKSVVYRMSNGLLSTEFTKKMITLIKNSEAYGIRKKGTLVIEDNDMTYEQAKALTVRRYNAMMKDLAEKGISIEHGVDADGVPTIDINKTEEKES
jgi:hypothetical protein